MRLGLMGGTFDPVHYGHLVIAEVARANFGLDRVIWIPAGDPPHKDRVLAPQEHRYAMVALATADHPQFELSRLELEREGPSYTLDTVRHFQAETPSAELFFIIGADAILEFLTWHRHADLIRSCRFLAATRPGYDLADLNQVLPMDYLERITPYETPGLVLSGTGIRFRMERGETIRYLVPESVEAYLREHNLYGHDRIPGEARPFIDQGG